MSDDKNEDLHTWSPCLTPLLYALLMTSKSIANEVTISRQLWREHVTSDIYTLDIDFIHGDIHGRSCEEVHFILLVSLFLL